MNEVTIFNSPQFGQIRTLTIDGEPWFVGKDVATALGYANTKDALGKHIDSDDRRGSRITTPSGAQDMTVINESGLYSLIMSSKLPEAKKFKRWVTSDVLPAIRKTGGYLGGNIEDIITKTVTAAVTAAMSELMKQIVPLVTAAV
ncbi:MAG: Bro-N domain-containing protein, partial [Ruminococcus sp.]|nr:Bro-N domain-containing protein [Ruminococcus sp.]